VQGHLAASQGPVDGQTCQVALFGRRYQPGHDAFALVPAALVGAFVDAKHIADGHTALLSQGVLAAFITEGHLAQHLRTTWTIYNERRLAFLEEAQVLDGLLAFEPAIAGMHVTGLLRDRRIDDSAVAAESVRRRVSVDPLSKYGAIDGGGLVFATQARRATKRENASRLCGRQLSIKPNNGAFEPSILGGWSVKVYLTENQVLRLLSVDERCNLLIVRRSYGESYDKRNSRRPPRASAICRRRNDRFGACFPVCDADRIV
jgi:hypothetical protein